MLAAAHGIPNPIGGVRILNDLPIRKSGAIPVISNNAGLAQMVEQLTCNEKVASSILATGTNKEDLLCHKT